MTIHYHGADINGLGPECKTQTLETLAGKFFCVSFAYPRQVKRCHEIGQGVMLDCGAFSFFTKGKGVDWEEYYKWIEPWLESPTTWAVIPDVIDGAEDNNKSLVLGCKFPRHKMAPVWHLHESLDYLRWIADTHHRFCFGSSREYWQVGSDSWHRRISEAFEAIWDRKPWVHMLRGMQCSDMQYPFGSVDSTDIARHHHTAKNGIKRAREMADRWDAKQCPITFIPQPSHTLLIGEHLD